MTAIILPSEKETINLAAKIANRCRRYLESHNYAIIIYLTGDLGAGKTTFSRGFLQNLGVTGKVKSPTYTLVESYPFDDFTVYHFDLYRLTDAEELEYIGIRDYFSFHGVCIIEWPQQAEGFLPPADLWFHLSYLQEHRQIELIAQSKVGQEIINPLFG